MIRPAGDDRMGSARLGRGYPQTVRGRQPSLVVGAMVVVVLIAACTPSAVGLTSASPAELAIASGLAPGTSRLDPARQLSPSVADTKPGSQDQAGYQGLGAGPLNQPADVAADDGSNAWPDTDGQPGPNARPDTSAHTRAHVDTGAHAYAKAGRHPAAQPVPDLPGFQRLEPACRLATCGGQFGHDDRQRSA
jgi:hypothetical protein